jgi:hypothetical protein
MAVDEWRVLVLVFNFDEETYSESWGGFAGALNFTKSQMHNISPEIAAAIDVHAGKRAVGAPCARVQVKETNLGQIYACPMLGPVDPVLMEDLRNAPGFGPLACKVMEVFSSAEEDDIDAVSEGVVLELTITLLYTY